MILKFRKTMLEECLKVMRALIEIQVIIVHTLNIDRS